MAITRVESDSARLDDTSGAGKFTPAEMQADIIRYWGAIPSERKFILPFWKAQELIANSQTRQLAFNVFNIEDPAEVDAEWVSNDPIPEDTSGLSLGEQLQRFFYNMFTGLASLFAPDVETASFLLGEDYFPLDADEGFKGFGPFHRMNIVGRIGRTQAGLTIVFLIVGEIVLIIDPGAGGPGDISGAKIPPG